MLSLDEIFNACAPCAPASSIRAYKNGLRTGFTIFYYTQNVSIVLRPLKGIVCCYESSTETRETFSAPKAENGPRNDPEHLGIRDNISRAYHQCRNFKIKFTRCKLNFTNVNLNFNEMNQMTIYCCAINLNGI